MQYNPVNTFLMEAEELLAAIEQSALSLGTEEGAGETVNQLFRAFHTIKGSGAMCGLDAVAGFTHHLEDLLDRVRDGAVPRSPALIDMVLRAKDHIKILLGVEQGGPPAVEGSGESLIAAIRELASIASPADGDEGRVTPPVQAEDSTAGEERTWLIRFRPNRALLANGGNPFAVLRDLQKLGRCEITAHTDEVPLLEDIQPDQCYLRWSMELHCTCDRNEIRDVFLFVEDDGMLEIEPLEDQPPQSKLIEAVSPGSPAAGQQAGGAVPGPAAPARKTLAKESNVRVPSDRLDCLVNLVGELVMNQSRLAQATAQTGSAECTNLVQELERLVAEMRDNVLGIRMLPIGTLFGRFRRLVHDLSVELGKEVDLVTEGEETELDKSILDQLGEPLVHCLRNCLDHGAEPPEERLAKGKPRHVTLRLSATHTGSNVVIGIQDDGRGIDREAVRAKAVEKQLIAQDARLSDKEIFNLILTPGFSTARQVTAVSGRGVGMDAVKRQIDILRGTLSLDSHPDKGTRVSITLPLTLAIIEGLLVQVGGEHFIIPMAAVWENVELLRSERARNNGRNLIAVRGELVPYIDLRQIFGLPGEAPSIEKIVIVQQDENRVGLVVDRVLGTHQTVIQSLGRFFRNISVVSGATIMGNGRVALIMDVAAVVRHADHQCQERAA